MDCRLFLLANVSFNSEKALKFIRGEVILSCMKVSTFLHDCEGHLVKNFLIPSIENRHEVVKQDKCICQLATQLHKRELGDLVFIHPSDTNQKGCYDAISRFVDLYQDVQFYICVLVYL